MLIDKELDQQAAKVQDAFKAMERINPLLADVIMVSGPMYEVPDIKVITSEIQKFMHGCMLDLDYSHLSLEDAVGRHR